ncbi:MAG: phage major capsid protein [Pseudomonadota bacterium]
MKTFKEQISDLQATRKDKTDAMKSIQAKASEQSRTPDTGEQEQFDTLKSDIGQIDKAIGNLRDLEAMEAVDLADASTVKSVSDADKRKGTISTDRTHVEVKHTEKLEPGIAFARMARVKALAFTGQSGSRDELQIAKSIYPGDDRLVNAITKTAVPAANTLAPTWAGNLITEGGVAFADFVEYLRANSLHGQIFPRFRRLPFDAPVLVQGSGGVAQFTKEGEAKPVTQWTYTKTKLTPLKIAAIAAATKETLMRASVNTDAFIRDELARSVNAGIDGVLISDAAAVTDESPAGLLNGTSALTLTGDGTVAGIRRDIAQMLKELVGDNLSVAGAFWVMPETVAIDLALATNEVGAPAFPGVTPTGGTLAGLPVFTSQYVPTETAGPVVALIKGDEIFLGDEGGIQVSVSDQASIQMDTAPTQNSIGTPTATASVSMFQTNSVAFLVERFVNWQKRRAAAVVWAHVSWEASGS